MEQRKERLIFTVEGEFVIVPDRRFDDVAFAASDFDDDEAITTRYEVLSARTESSVDLVRGQESRKMAGR